MRTYLTFLICFLSTTTLYAQTRNYTNEEAMMRNIKCEYATDEDIYIDADFNDPENRIYKIKGLFFRELKTNIPMKCAFIHENNFFRCESEDIEYLEIDLRTKNEYTVSNYIGGYFVQIDFDAVMKKNGWFKREKRITCTSF